jgi:hypothetical protein
VALPHRWVNTGHEARIGRSGDELVRRPVTFESP